ncbi:NAD(P)-dependent dehydrogenase, short-chain alcohol dehydrogenase family [Vibrio xiamenensis]|uniref:NAD(P)-dependent dehydrogenase, short-chain alcohol dehydrogenase family n=1 Tax=Vibrio xiamenensis TaxID=861298 RepID=A0A1G7ZKU1_9VIBR|nr:glucose 1-dehydrogenase [Vibrio xiamenensis]SDH09298.1 NAD(P)-dependent dehydrogenase, short-chain alcohol dehydrogenase family [Vibrio xiamenensis]
MQQHTPNSNLAAPVVLITGGGRGIGAASAKRFAKAGYQVVVNYLSNHQAAQALKQEIEALGTSCMTVAADVSNEQQVSNMFAEIKQQFGALDVLVNNAGILETQSRMDDISVERFERILRTNVISCFLCAKAAVKQMSTRYGGNGGAIVNVSSGAAKSGSPNEYVDYAASKGAMDSLTRGLALEVANEGVRVNGVRPGLIYTEMHASGGEPLRVQRLQSKIPLQRGGEAEEVAEAIFWLASNQSSFVTGTFIDTTGGL